MEIEIKVRVEKGSNIKQFLEKEGEQAYTNKQVDEYHTPAHEDFTAVDPVVEWLRLRDSDGKFSINYKHWHHESDGRSHHCDEYETKVEDIESLRNILKALDFKHLVTVNKIRSVWNYKDYEISLDTVEGLGDFVEIEYKGNTDNVVPSEITEQMLAFIRGLDCGELERDFRGYPYLLLEQKNKNLSNKSLHGLFFTFNLKQHSKCYNSPMDLKETYNRIAEDWVKDHDKDTWGKAGADMFLSFLPKGATILDVGCGGGIKTNYLANQGYNASGVDFSEKMIEIAKRDYPHLVFEVLDMYDIEQYPKTVDGIFVQAALLHIKKGRVLEVLQKMKDKLNPGGVMYIAVKTMRDDGVEEEIKTESDYGYEYSRFFSYFTSNEIKAYFNQLQMEIVWEGSATTLSHWVQVIVKKA